MSSSPIITSAKVQCYINGVLVGRVTGFRWSSDTPRKEIYAIDSGTPYELAPTTYRCTGTINLLRLTLDGGAEAMGLTAHSSQVVRERYATITLIDRSSDQLLFRADFCSVTNQSWEVAERSVMRGTISFTGVYWNNETKTSNE